MIQISNVKIEHNIQVLFTISNYFENILECIENKPITGLGISVKLKLKLNLNPYQFGEPQVQKLCFLPPKIAFIEAHFKSEKNFVSKTIKCLKKMLV